MKVLTNVAFGAALLMLVACATNPIVGHGITQTGRYTGNVGVTGNGTVLTIEAGSDVPKLSIVGDACKVTVQDGARVERIEFWGTANRVTIPDNLSPRVSSVGTNTVIHRSQAEMQRDASGEAVTPQ